MATSIVKSKGKISKYFKEVLVELKKVTWPTKNQLIKHTLTVLAACAVIGTVIWIADFIFNLVANAFYSL